MASAAPKPLELPERLRSLHDFLDGKGDVDIVEIFAHHFGDLAPRRNAQQRLGPLVTRLNRRLRLHGKAVKPGTVKGTYCLTTL